MTSRANDKTVADTIARSFLLAVSKRGPTTALRHKHLGVWQAVSWNDWLEIAKEVAYGLDALGFKPGDTSSILASTMAEWVYADMGVVCAGGVSSGIYPTDSVKQVEYLLNDSRTSVIFVEDDEQLDKVLDCRGRCPTLRKIIVFDMKGLDKFHDDMVISFDELLATGRNNIVAHPEKWEAMINSRGPKDVVMLVYTSGTTGPAKGAMHTNFSLMAQLKHADKYLPPGHHERLLFLPLCHIAERLGGYYNSVALGGVMNFAESPETVPDNLREVQPTIFLAVPRIWEKLYSSVMIALKDAKPIERWFYDKAIRIGFKAAEYRLEGKQPPLGLKIANALGRQFVLRNMRRMMGIDRCKMALTGAAPISPELIKWYFALGIDMLEVYGQTENGGLATCMPPEKIKLGTIGKPVEWGELKLSPEGEILLRGDYVFAGYLNQPDKTAETIDKDGWLHTGDVGIIDNEGYVRITDRMKDIIITAGGKNITPSEIENGLKFSPYISDAIVIGDKRAFLTCLVMIDQENCEKYAQDQNVPFTNYSSLCKAKEIRDLIWSEIEKVNEGFARVETIKKFHLIDQQLSPEDEELTPTMKLKRSFVGKKYAAEIEAMYSDKAAA